MSYSLSVWLDDDTNQILKWLCGYEKRTRSGMIKALILREKERMNEQKALEVIINDTIK